MEKGNNSPVTFSGTVHQVATGDHATLIYNANGTEENTNKQVNLSVMEVSVEEEDALKEFIFDDAKRGEVIARLLHVYNAHDLAFQVVSELREEVGRYKAVKQRFIKALLPFAPNFTEGTSINNIREQINKMLETHKWPR